MRNKESNEQKRIQTDEQKYILTIIQRNLRAENKVNVQFDTRTNDKRNYISYNFLRKAIFLS